MPASSNIIGAPTDFLAKMARLLGHEFPLFRRSYEQEPHVGLRVNTLKISPFEFAARVPFSLEPVGAHEPAGFLLLDDSKPGSHPYHAAGLYYLQEPSAMVVGGLVDPQPGELVLDLAAAPGGKATHLATRMQDKGLLVANDVDAGRARLLAENLERWGVYNTLITNATPQRLAQTFGPIFDRVLVDAPCSGEGMFRRQGAFAWREEIVAACARRQTAVLDSAAQLVKPGGLLVYATCTFSPEENEQVIADFLAGRDEFELERPSLHEGFAPGRPSWIRPEQAQIIQPEQLARAVRLWPHRFPGEGHFIALLRKSGYANKIYPYSLRYQPPYPNELHLWRTFARDHLQIDLTEERMLAINGRLYLLPEKALDTSGLKLVRYGLLLGELRQGYFKPAHTLALALSATQVRHTVNWPADSAEIQAYLAGHDVDSAGPDAWTLVTADGFTLGWGKRVNGRLKNHYPRGLRIVKREA